MASFFIIGGPDSGQRIRDTSPADKNAERVTISGY